MNKQFRSVSQIVILDNAQLHLQLLLKVVVVLYLVSKHALRMQFRELYKLKTLEKHELVQARSDVNLARSKSWLQSRVEMAQVVNL